MSWLERLKYSRTPETGVPKVTKGASGTFGTALSGTSEFFSDTSTEEPATIVAALLADAAHAEPTTHCPTCGSPSWWLAPAGWCCAYCTPRPAEFAGTSLIVASGAWAPGTAAPDIEEEAAPAAQGALHRDDGRTADAWGARRSEAHHAARAAFYAHHDACPTCRRAGRRRDLSRCPAGAALYGVYSLAALADTGGPRP